MTKYADRRLCRCKHAASSHTGKYSGTTTACMSLVDKDEMSWCQCQSFKLDTLKYLTQLAQERGQI